MTAFPTFAERIAHALPSRHRMRSTSTPAPVGTATPAHTHPFSDILFSGLTAGTFLKATGLTTVAFTALAASDIQSGILGVPRGGTGVGNVPFHSVLLGDDASPLVPLANSSGAVRYLRSSAVGLVTWGQVAYSELSGTPSSFPPAAHTHPLSDLTGGIEAGDYVRYNGAQWARTGPGVDAREIIGGLGAFGSFAGVASENFAFHSTINGRILHFGANSNSFTWGSSYNAIEYGARNALMYRNADADVYRVSNAYFDGSNWRYMANGGAAYYRMHGGADRHSFRTAASGTAGDAITWTVMATFDHTGPSFGVPLPVGSGGIGSANPPFGSVLVGNDTLAMTVLANSSGGVRFLRSSAVGAVTWGQVAYSELTGTPPSFPPAAHTHPLSDLTGGIEAGDHIRYNGSNWARKGPDIGVIDTGRFYVDGWDATGDTYIHQSAANILGIVTGAATHTFVRAWGFHAGGAAPAALFQAGSDYPSVGYNAVGSSSNGAYTYRNADTALRIHFNSTQMKFMFADAGSAGAAITWAETFRITTTNVLSLKYFQVQQTDAQPDLVLSGSATNGRTIWLGDSSVFGAVGSLYSAGSTFVTSNAYQVHGSDSWTQSHTSFSSVLLNLSYGSTALALYAKAAGASPGTFAAFWTSTPIFSITNTGHVILKQGAAVFFDGGSNDYLQGQADNLVQAVVAGSHAIAWQYSNSRVHFNMLNGGVQHATHSGYSMFQFGSYNMIMFRDGLDMYYLQNVYYDGTWKRASAATATLMQADNSVWIWYRTATGAADSAITWSEKFRIDDAVKIYAGVLLYFDGGGDTAMRETSDNVLDVIVGGGTRAGFKSAVVEIYTDLVVSGQMRSNQTTITVASGDTTKTVDFSTGNQHVLSMSNSSSCAITLSNMATGGWYSIELLGVGSSRSFTITNTLKVLSGSVGASVAVDKRKLLVFYFDGTHIMTVAHTEILAA